MGNAQKRVHFPGRVFIKAVGVVYQQIIRFPDAARRLLAEAAHGGGQGEHPDGGADGYMLEGGKIDREGMAQRCMP